MVKDKLAKCDRVSQQCFQNGDHNKTTLRFLTPEFGPTKDWMYFQSASQNKLDWDVFIYIYINIYIYIYLDTRCIWLLFR